MKPKPKYFDFKKFKPKSNHTETEPYWNQTRKLDSIQPISVGFFGLSVFCTPLLVAQLALLSISNRDVQDSNCSSSILTMGENKNVCNEENFLYYNYRRELDQYEGFSNPTTIICNYPKICNYSGGTSQAWPINHIQINSET